jgi:hypothetical protein
MGDPRGSAPLRIPLRMSVYARLARLIEARARFIQSDTPDYNKSIDRPYYSA